MTSSKLASLYTVGSNCLGYSLIGLTVLDEGFARGAPRQSGGLGVRGGGIYVVSISASGSLGSVRTRAYAWRFSLAHDLYVAMDQAEKVSRITVILQIET